MKGSDRLDIAVKLIATAIACFGVWKFFADRAAEARAEAKNRSLGYIARFADDKMVQSRKTLLDFWSKQPAFVAATRDAEISEPAYERFVSIAFGRSEARLDISAALFDSLVFFDEVAFCHQAGICDKAILDAFFCKYAERHARVYGPFYALISDEIGSMRIDSELQAYAQSCAAEGPPDGG